MFGKQRFYWPEDVCEGNEVLVEQAAALHQVQASRQARQPEERETLKRIDISLLELVLCLVAISIRTADTEHLPFIFSSSYFHWQELSRCVHVNMSLHISVFKYMWGMYVNVLYFPY